jgi:hypothetical protein
VEPVSVAGRGRGGLQKPQKPAPAKAGGDLAIRPVFHQLEARVEAHVFIAFLAYCLHVTLARRLHALAPGLTPRSVLEKFAAMHMIDVHLPTTDGCELVLASGWRRRICRCATANSRRRSRSPISPVRSAPRAPAI